MTTDHICHDMQNIDSLRDDEKRKSQDQHKNNFNLDHSSNHQSDHQTNHRPNHQLSHLSPYYQLRESPYQLSLQVVPASGRIAIWLRENMAQNLNNVNEQQSEIVGEEGRSTLFGYYCWEEARWYHLNLDITFSKPALREIEHYAKEYALRRDADFSTKRILIHYLSRYSGYTL